MRKNKSKQLLLAALAGLFLFTPVQCVPVPQSAYAAQVADPHDSRLSAFDIAPGVLSPAFSPDILEYTSTVDADVTSVSVQAVPRSTSSVIASVEGRDGLKPGVNTIKVVCAAQDNTSTAYTITLTVGSVSQETQQPAGEAAGRPDSTRNQPEGSTGQSQPEDSSGESGQEADAQGTGTEKKKKKKKSSAASKLTGKVSSDGSVSLSGASYKLSGNFSYGSITQDIPSAFGEGSLDIGGSSYPTLYCGTNGVHLVYMENTDGNGSSGFYYYDEKQNAVERFKYTGIGDNFVVFISNARKEVPQGYTETSLKLASGKEVAACQNASSDAMQDFYLIYGINSDGTDGWYLYDSTQGTYLRYLDAFHVQPQEEEGQEEQVRTVSLVKYNSLNEKYTELKENRVKLVSIFVIVILLLIIAFTAVLLRSQDDGEDDEEEGRERVRKAKRKPQKKAAPVSKSSLAAGRDFEGIAGKRAKKVTKNITQEPDQELPAGGFVDEITPPDKIREQLEKEKNAYGFKQKEQKPYDRKLGEKADDQKHREQKAKVFGQKPGGLSQKDQNAYGQKLNSQKTYEQKIKDQQVFGRKPGEQKAYGQKLKEQQTYEQKLSEQKAYEQKLKEQQTYEQKLKEQQAYEQKLKNQRAYEQQLYEQKLKEQKAYEQKLKEQQAYEQKLKEQQAYEQKLKEQQAYEQKLKEQQAYEQKLKDQRAYEQQLYEQQRAYSQKDAFSGQGREVLPNLLKNGEDSASSDSVQLAAERMRQSVRFSRGVPKAEPVRTEPEPDPMDDWDMEDSSRKPQKSARASKKKRRMDDDDMEIMDLNDL